MIADAQTWESYYLQMATPHQIEIRALRVIDRIINSRPAEDDLVECKTKWPDDHRKAARQIAALCNAARGEDSMWLIGLNEGRAEVNPTAVEELANWWPKVERCFGDQISPDLQNLVVPTPDGVVVALNFGTRRAPYLVSTNGTNGVDFEVPIRAGNSTRTARRHELILMMSEEVNAPIIELIDSRIRMYMTSEEELAATPNLSGDIDVTFVGSIFVSTNQPITIPYHRMKGRIVFPDPDIAAELDLATTSAFAHTKQTTVGFTKLASGFYFNASDGVDLRAHGRISRNVSMSVQNFDSLSIELEFHIAGRERPVQVRQNLLQSPKDDEYSIINIRTVDIGTWTGSLH